MSEYRLKKGKAEEKITKAYRKVEDTVAGGYKGIEDTVVGGYKGIEDTVVNSYKKIEKKFIDRFLEEIPPEAAPAADDKEETGFDKPVTPC